MQHQWRIQMDAVGLFFKRRNLLHNRLGGLTFPAVLVSVLILLSSCAYHLGAGNRKIPGGYRTVAVPVFKNNSHDSGIEVYFTNALVRELQRAQVGVLAEKENAQTTLEGIIESVSVASSGPIQGTGFSSDGNQYPKDTVLNSALRVNVTTTIRLRRNSDKKVLWEGSFTRGQSYQAPRIGYEDLNALNALYSHSARYQNIEVLAREMMSEAHDRLTENF